MKRPIRTVLAPLLAATLPIIASAQPSELPGWRMIYAEEFNGSAVDPARWNFENVAWPYNAEQEYYLPQQATASGGLLNIKAERRTVGTRQYVSARIDTRGKFETQYGRFEARMKVPAGQGLWPAFWLLPATNSWPPEIDIMEALGHQPTTVYMTHHWGTSSNVMSHGGSFVGPDFTAGYHCYAVEWGPYRVDWLVDDVVRFSSTANFPREPMYIILNLAVGGQWPGNPNASTPFPSSLLVDWVRVYQRDVPLANPGFEELSGSSIAGWQPFGNAQQAASPARTGAASARISGTSGAGPFYSGVFQDLPASPGQLWQASGFARHASSSRLATGNFVDLKIEWYGANNEALGVNSVQALASTSTADAWLPASVQATAPANTAKARIAVVLAQPGAAGGGPAYIDDIAFGFLSPNPVAVCEADFNGSGDISVQDIFDFLSQYFLNNPRVDTNKSFTITVQDIFDFLALYFDPC